jgi:hypothetical protein
MEGISEAFGGDGKAEGRRSGTMSLPWQTEAVRG